MFWKKQAVLKYSLMSKVTGVTASKASLIHDSEWKNVAPFGDSVTLDVGVKIDLKTDIRVSLPYGYEFTVNKIKFIGVAGIRYLFSNT